TAQDTFDQNNSRIAKINQSLNSGKPGIRVKDPGQRKALRQEMQRLTAAQNLAKKQIPALQAQLGRVQANPNVISGIHRDKTEAEKQQAEEETLLGQKSLAALKGDYPIDPALMRQTNEQESVLRQHLANTLGPDYENTTQGSEALRAFNESKVETFENERRKAIAQFIPEQSGLS